MRPVFGQKVFLLQLLAVNCRTIDGGMLGDGLLNDLSWLYTRLQNVGTVYVKN